MALKKSQLYSSLWQSCDELRGGMDASQYKDYVLTLLFMKYVSDKHAGRPDAPIDVPSGGGFADIAALQGDKEIGDKINTIITKFAEANDLRGVIDQADFNDDTKLGTGKEMQDRLSRLVGIFDSLDFRTNRAGGDDLLGDAYEYLMRHFATESGKSKGQFYTPAEVSYIMARVIGVGPGTRPDQTIYDPTCGSGSLLLKAADQARHGITVYGQEMDNATWALARMNMILHGHPTADLRRGNTLAVPSFKNGDDGLKTFDFAVANPPFSAKAWSSGLDPAHDEFGRFESGVPPARNGDFAFLLHLIASLKSRGKGGIILPHGVLFRGNREADIRRNLIRRGLIKGVIGLPPNLFYGTGIPACILVLDKEDAHARTGIFMIDASKGFRKDGNKNRLRPQDIHRIVDVFNNQTEAPRYSRMVPVAQITAPANDYNLNIPRYIDSSEPEDLHDLDAHVNGGIPDRDIDAMNSYWESFPSLRQALFEGDGRTGYSQLRIKASDVKATILGNSEFQAYQRLVSDIFEIWRTAHDPPLRNLSARDLPSSIIDTLSEELLACFARLPLVNPYDIYQRLMDYWSAAMHDDVYLITSNGWLDAARPRETIEDKNRKIKETPDLTVKRRRYKMDLIPPALLVARYFADAQAAIETQSAKHETTVRKLAEFVEEHLSSGDDDGLLADATNDKGKVTKGRVQDRLRSIGNEPDNRAERRALQRCLALIDSEASAGKILKEARAALHERVLARYSTLTEAEIKTLVTEDKWFASICAAIDDEIHHMTSRFTRRIRQLEERYSEPLADLERKAAAFATKVEGHLRDAATRKLLIGETRLPSFSGDWTTKRIGDLLKYERPDRYIVRSTNYVEHGGVPGLTGNKSFVLGYSDENFGVCRDIPAIVFDDFTTDCKYADFPFKVKSSAIKLLRAKHDRVNLIYVFERMKLVQFPVSDHKRYYISEYQNIELPMPSHDEQMAIVSILSDMDAGIEAMQRRIDKIRAVKQGMAQQLLTGRTRLPRHDLAAAQ